ncbi:MAG TPA: pyridoxamine 5'-phosphate oxidase family protein [Micromonosporaceae bacterium]
MRWREFAESCPEFAGPIRERFEREQIFLLGTVRPDGSPRISGVECDFVSDDLMTGMIWRSTKALDLLRDQRMTIHSLVPDKAHESESQGDIKLYGRAVEITDPDQRRRYEDAIEARIDWRPPEPYHCFAVDIDRVGLVRFAEEGRHVWSWHAGGELHKRVAPVPPTG